MLKSTLACSGGRGRHPYCWSLWFLLCQSASSGANDLFQPFRACTQRWGWEIKLLRLTPYPRRGLIRWRDTLVACSGIGLLPIASLGNGVVGVCVMVMWGLFVALKILLIRPSPNLLWPDPAADGLKLEEQHSVYSTAALFALQKLQSKQKYCSLVAQYSHKNVKSVHKKKWMEGLSVCCLRYLLCMEWLFFVCLRYLMCKDQSNQDKKILVALSCFIRSLS